MLTPDQILENLQHIVDDWHPLAIAWHAYFAVLAVTAGFGVRPSRRVAGVLLALPLFSVSALAWATRNPFNGAVFALSGGRWR